MDPPAQPAEPFPQVLEATPRRVPFREAFRFWLKLGFINFGGPTGQIAILHQEVVERRRWISNERFLHALNYCMLLPGPEAQQLSVYIGWLLHGTVGGLVAGTLFVLPGAILMLGLSWLYATKGDVSWVAAIFYGLRPAVLAIVTAAVLRIGSKALRSGFHVSIAALAFLAIFLLQAPFPLVILTAAAAGLVQARLRPESVGGSLHAEPEARAAPLAVPDGFINASTADLRAGRSLRVLAVGLAAWWGPLALVLCLRGTSDVLSQEALFFSKAAMITFGGAYAVLWYINRQAVEVFGWLEPGQMVTGLGLAETTPGPLILVTQFVGFLGAYQHPGGLDPLLAGTLGAIVTTWATFAPCFLWIFLGAPFIEKLRGHRGLNAALGAITAAVVGVILNLAVVLGLPTLFQQVRAMKIAGLTFPVPVVSSIHVVALVLCVVAFVGLRRWKWGVVQVVLGCALVSLILRWAGLLPETAP